MKFTATGAPSLIDYPNVGSHTWSYSEGIILRNFFTNPGGVLVQDFVGSFTSLTANALTDSANTPTLNKTFREVSAWNDDHQEYWSSYGVPGTGNGFDITLWSNESSPGGMNFSTGAAAFYGESVFDLSGYAGYTSLFPAFNSTGLVRIWTDDGGLGNSVIGSWQVVGAAAIPEPATYAVLFGAVGLVIAIRRGRQSGAGA